MHIAQQKPLTTLCETIFPIYAPVYVQMGDHCPFPSNYKDTEGDRKPLHANRP